MELSRQELRELLEVSGEEELDRLYRRAYEMKLAHVGAKTYFRGIIEFSNICDKDCYYCGIRKSNRRVTRFMMSDDEIVESAAWAHAQRYGSIVLQSGERQDREFSARIARLLTRIHDRTAGQLGVTLSLGEQTEETFQRWFEAGAVRYLLRIETSNPALYRRLHPADHNFETRRQCLRTLREIGYQVGTGVMIGLPFQTLDDLAGDLLFFKECDIDMIGMGPYIVHHDTPLAASSPDFKAIQATRLTLGLKMIAAARLLLEDVNIAATTALQALHPAGREMGILAGANIIMPNITATKYRPLYQLYENKPRLDENASLCRNCLERRIATLNETVGYGERGDAPHYAKRMAE